jgi:tetratricopeptide (TPR) repeat protein
MEFNNKKIKFEKLFKKGINNYKKYNYWAAIRCFDKALFLFPENSKVYYALSSCYYKINDFNLMKKNIENAIKFDPTNPKYQKILERLNNHSLKASPHQEKYNSPNKSIISTFLTILGIFFIMGIISMAVIGFTQGPDQSSLQSRSQLVSPVQTQTNEDSNIAFYENPSEGYRIAYPKYWSVFDTNTNDQFSFEKDPQKRAQLIALTTDNKVTLSDSSRGMSLDIITDYEAANYDFDEYIDSIFNQYRSVRGMGLLTGQKFNLDREKTTISGFPAYIIKFSDYQSLSIDGFINTGDKIIQLNYVSPGGKYEDMDQVIELFMKNMNIF